MKPMRELGMATGLAMALSLGGCWGGSDDDNTPVAAGTGQDVPDSAGASAVAFVAYLLTLVASDETSEPAVIKDSFAVPPDDAGDAQPLT